MATGLEGVPCPRCGTRMEYWVEIEVDGSDGRRVKYYYRCPRCGYRINDAVVRVKRSNGSIAITVEEYRLVRRVRVGAVRRRS